MEQAALQRQPGATAALENGQRRKPATAGARLANRPDDRRLRRNKGAERYTVGGDSRAEDEMRRWAQKREDKVKRRVEALTARDEEGHDSDDEYTDSELLGLGGDIDPVAALVIPSQGSLRIDTATPPSTRST